MLLYVTGPQESTEARALDVYRDIAERWAALAGARNHPRSGTPLIPAITRLDLFLAAFSPALSPGESGLRIQIPPPERWWRWAPAMRRALRELVLSTFPPGPRFGTSADPVGPCVARPAPDDTTNLRDLVPLFRDRADPAQKPVDPRLWLVLAPPLPEALEPVFLSTFLRAEPFARIARVPGHQDGVAGWLDEELDHLLAGRGLVTAGLVVDLEKSPMPSLITEGDGGAILARSDLFDLVSGLEELYATRETLEPGEVYARLHSHSGSEELYVILEGEGVIRVNERALPIKAGQCFGKPRGYDCSSQILNTGPTRMVLLDLGTMDSSEVDLCRYPEHGELMARFGGHGWFVPTEAIRPTSELGPFYERRYFRKTTGSVTPSDPSGKRCVGEGENG